MGANAQTEVPTFTAGQVLTAAQMNNSARTGVPVFATTTTRDAAFGGAGEKTLAQGQLCFIEATNTVQYYTGSTWATVGPTLTAGQFSGIGYEAAAQTTSSTTYTDLATVGPSVALTTGTSAILILGAFISDSGNLGNNGWMSAAVSGATTIAANDLWGAFGPEGLNGVASVQGCIIGGLTPGVNTFTAKYKKVGGTSTAEFQRRWMFVQAL